MRTNLAVVTCSVIAGFLALLGMGLGIGETRESRPTAHVSGSANSTVIVELFTSEGCSSCPPADSLLKKLSEEAAIPGVEIIALEEHVDYWDHLGWKDPFSSSAFTERQNDYARKFGNGGAYTPQMVIDGQKEVVGSRSQEARELIQKAAGQPKLAIRLTRAAGSGNEKAAFDIDIAGTTALSGGKEAELWVAVTEKNLHTDVKAGENSGERLQHAAVVRSLRKVETFHGPNDYLAHASLKLDPSWQQSNLTFVAFAVEKTSHKIIGAAAAGISQSNGM